MTSVPTKGSKTTNAPVRDTSAAVTGLTRSAPRVYLGMSGGVDSSVSALLLKEQGYNVTGIYMKNWSKDLPGMKCPWAEDLADAKRVAVKLGLNFEVWDFEKAYKEKVVDYMLAEFKQGRTPNPDIMCNEEIKFKLFYETAMSRGADFIATGHYARTVAGALQKSQRQILTLAPQLLRAIDENKDQTYFLYRISDEALSHTLFPIGGMLKPEVKKLAALNGLHNAYKKESMGVCFVGEVGMKDFLREYLDVEPGEIREAETEKVLGYHDGAIFYTIGQRHGLYLNGTTGEINDGLPYYVVSKDLKRNIIYVSKNLNHTDLWTKELVLEDVVIRNSGKIALAKDTATKDTMSKDNITNITIIKTATKDTISQKILVRLRHRAPLIPAKLVIPKGTGPSTSPHVARQAKLIFEQEIKRPASGQSAVFYDKEVCLGGGIIK